MQVKRKGLKGLTFKKEEVRIPEGIREGDQDRIGSISRSELL